MVKKPACCLREHDGRMYIFCGRFKSIEISDVLYEHNRH